MTSTSTQLDKYRDYTEQLLTQMSEFFSECEKIKSLRQKFKLLANEDMFLMSTVRAHFDHLETPLPNTVAYAAPLTRVKQKRVESSRATLYDAYLYNDFDSLTEMGSTPIIDEIGLSEKWNHEDLDNNSKHGIFQYLCALNECVYHIMERPLPVHVSSDEIQHEILLHKEQLIDTPTQLQKAFSDLLHKLIDEVYVNIEGTDKISHTNKLNEFIDKSPSAIQSTIEQWHHIMSTEIDSCNHNNINHHKYVRDVCTAKEWNFLAELFTSYSLDEDKYLCNIDLSRVTCDSQSEQCLSTIVQLNIISKLSQNAPPHLLEVVESKAGELAKELSQGSFNLDPQRVMALGEDILTQVDPADIQVFTQMLNGEMGSILDILSTHNTGGNLDNISGALQMIGHMQ